MRTTKRERKTSKKKAGKTENRALSFLKRLLKDFLKNTGKGRRQQQKKEAEMPPENKVYKNLFFIVLRNAEHPLKAFLMPLPHKKAPFAIEKKGCIA